MQDRRFTLSMLAALAALVVAFASSFATYALSVSRSNDLASASLVSCLGIEDLKSAQREEAVRNFKNLDQTLAILGIEKTPELVVLSRNTRDDALLRFKAKDC